MPEQRALVFFENGFYHVENWSAKIIHRTNPLPVEHFGIRICSFYRHQSKYNQVLLVVYVEFHLVLEWILTEFWFRCARCYFTGFSLLDFHRIIFHFTQYKSIRGFQNWRNITTFKFISTPLIGTQNNGQTWNRIKFDCVEWRLLLKGLAADVMLISKISIKSIMKMMFEYPKVKTIIREMHKQT